LRDLWRRLPWLWLFVLLLFGAFVADALLPVASSASETTKTLRSQSLTLLGSGLVGLVVFAFQTGRSRRERRREVLRDAYLLLIRAAARLWDLNKEEMLWPKGHPWQGTVSAATPGDASEAYLRHDPFARAKALAQEVNALSEEAAAIITLEDPEDPAVQAWRDVDDAYYRCVGERTKEKKDPNAIVAAEKELEKAIHQLGVICHQRLRALG